MPAHSKSQQRFFGMVSALKHGDLDTSNMTKKQQDKLEDVADSISVKAAREFASTPTKKLPIKVKSFKEFATLSDEDRNSLMEEWAQNYEAPSTKRGTFDGVSQAELVRELEALKRSGPHPEGSKDFTREREILFALRAKHGWKAAIK